MCCFPGTGVPAQLQTWVITRRLEDRHAGSGSASHSGFATQDPYRPLIYFVFIPGGVAVVVAVGVKVGMAVEVVVAEGVEVAVAEAVAVGVGV